MQTGTQQKHPDRNASSRAISSNPANDARRRQLIEATIICIHRFGLSRTTVAKVAGEAGLSVGTINFHFSTKDQLLLGVLEFVRDEFGEALFTPGSEDSDAAAIITKIMDVHLDPTISSPEKIAVWHAFSSASRHRADYNIICGEFESRLETLINKQFERLCEQAGNTAYRPHALARGLSGILDGLWQTYLYQPDQFKPAQARAQCLDYLNSLFPAEFGEQSAAAPNAAAASGVSSVSDLLPPWTYSSPAFLQLEFDHLFKPNWMLAGHISEVARPRDYLTFDGFGERALVVRGNDGKLRAFHNVCRHRGARLLEGRGSDCPHALSCPFHGWTYDLEGKLIGIPLKDTFEDLDPARNGLVPLDMEIWMGFVFIRFQSGGPSMQELMAPVEDIVAPYRVDEMTPLANTAYRQLRPYNWKVIHDIDNEGYHVPVGHPSLQQLYGRSYSDDYVGDIPVSSARLNDKPGRLWSVRHYQNLLPRFDHLPEDNQRLWLYIGIFPNMVVGLYPESVEFYMTIPEDTTSTWYLGRSYGLADDRRETRVARYLSRRINDQTDQEDESFVRGLQDGMRSSAYPVQKLSSREQGVRGFHKAVQRVLPVANLAEEPEPDQLRKTNAALPAAS